MRRIEPPLTSLIIDVIIENNNVFS